MKKNMNNKGFSLVELIIVIAIMAVLMGVLAPQYLKYVKESKVSTDITNAEQIATAVNVAVADEDTDSIKTTSGAGGDGVYVYDDGTRQIGLPASKVDESYSWTVTWDETNGVTQITLNSQEIWPTSNAYEDAELGD